MPRDQQNFGVKATAVAYARVAAPDLDLMEEFLTKLGMVRSARTSQKLFMRGTGERHHLHVTELGEPRNIGLAFEVSSEDDLRRIAKAPGASEVHEIDEPAGGKRVLLREPNGYQIEVVHGAKTVPVIEVPELKTNSAAHLTERKGRGPWGPDAPPHITRFGHGVLVTPEFEKTCAWYSQFLGMQTSDEIMLNEEIMATFSRFDRGSTFVDHHALNIARGPQAAWHHFSFEVANWSEVFSGSANLAKDKRFKFWVPPTRHYVGGQVGAYFGGPWGRMYEFWADGDQINAEHEPQKWPVQTIIEGPEWGGGAQPGFFDAWAP